MLAKPFTQPRNNTVKAYFLIFTLFVCTISYAQSIDTTIVNFKGNNFYHLKNEKNTKVLIFLHGGVKNPAFDDSSQIIGLDFLLEENKIVIPAAIRNGFDLLIPIKNDSLNWLSNHQYCYQTILSYLHISKPYTSRIISGFSDGGTGSYKIFYSNQSSLDGLVIFNGYPQHKNFNQGVKYEETKNKEVIFFSSLDDKTIPYEFLLTEYCKQKTSNPNTYLCVIDGKHSFDEYKQKHVDLCFDILNSKVTNSKSDAIHALMQEDEVIKFYPFRKNIYKKYAYGETYYLDNKIQSKLYKNKR